MVLFLRTFAFGMRIGYAESSRVQIPARCGPFDNGGYEDGEKLFLYFLRHLASSATVSDLIKQFGGEKSKWSRGFRWMAEWLYGTWGHLTSGIRPAMVARFQLYGNAIESYVNDLLIRNGSAPFPQGSLRIMGFLDCNQIPTNRPAGGPVDPGQNSARWPQWIQEAFYSGWKKNHGLKAQSLDFPDGLMGYLYGLESVKHSDINLLNWSDINNKLVVAQQNLGPGHQYCGYGDSAYPIISHIKSRVYEPAVDAAMSSARQSVEHHYGELGNYWPYIKNTKKLKICSSNPIEAIYFCVHLLRNLYTCLNGNKTSERFHIDPPTLEEYLAW
mmetsp:Transcript_30059/g.35428  ORF Transcript_30059/g.35428 Transcript_30059/m.35428 type:complete len:329 (+) Transcript_30059:447-1433(+)